MLPGGGGAGHAALGYGRGRPPCPPGKGPECQGALFIREGEKPAREGALVTWEPPPPPPRGGDSAQAAPGGGSASLTASEGAISLMLLRKERYDVP